MAPQGAFLIVGRHGKVSIATSPNNFDLGDKRISAGAAGPPGSYAHSRGAHRLRPLGQTVLTLGIATI